MNNMISKTFNRLKKILRDVGGWIIDNRDVVALIIVLIAVANTIIIGGAVVVRKHNIKTWNNGVCAKCGSNYEYMNSTDRYDIFACNECGHRIRLDLGWGDYSKYINVDEKCD